MLDPDALKFFIEKSGVVFTQNAISYIFTCPRCTKQKKLYLRKVDGIFRCFKCYETENFHGKPEYALAEIYGLDINHVREAIYNLKEKKFTGFLDLTFIDPYSNDDFGEIEDVELPEVTMPSDIIDFNDDKFTDGAKYLFKRGLKPEHIIEYGIKYHPVWQTVVFPVIADKKLVGWQERSTVSDFRYTLKGFKKEKALMFQDRLTDSPHAVLCEGPIDAIKAHLCGGNVASMGKGVSEAQLDIIKDKVKKLYLALDPDAPEMMDRICKSMHDYMEIYILLPPKGRKDLGECTFEEVYEQFLNAPKYTGQLFLHLRDLNVRR